MYSNVGQATSLFNGSTAYYRVSIHVQYMCPYYRGSTSYISSSMYAPLPICVCTSPLQTLLRSDLPSALESALRSDERTALDVMRLVELLLVLIVEGRKALPKSSNLAGVPRKLDSFTGDLNHRQVTLS